MGLHYRQRRHYGLAVLRLQSSACAEKEENAERLAGRDEGEEMRLLSSVMMKLMRYRL